MKVSNSITVFFLAFVFCQSVWSQNPHVPSDYGDWKRVVPQEPNIASLFKFNNIPINEYTGVPNISIPLHAIQEGEVQVPIALSYHSGGIKVGEEASNVGLGWTLLAGGAITRALDDKDDLRHERATLPDPPLSSGGHFLPRTSDFHTPALDANSVFPVNGVDTQLPLPLASYWSYVDRQDYVPDVFNFNFNGYSGSFVFTKDMEIFFLEDTDIKIEYIPGNNFYEDKFTAITPSGTLYEFAQTVVVTPHTSTGIPSSGYVSTWYLTKISSKTRAKEIQFIYDTKEDTSGIPSFTQNLFAINVSTSAVDTNNSRYTSPLFSSDGVYLERIVSPKASIDFGYSNLGERQDITTGYILENITVNETIGAQSTVKNFVLNHSYFGHSFDNGDNLSMQNNDYSQYINTPVVKNHTSHYSLRLRLDSIVEDNIRTHSFEYHTASSIPRKTSLSQDHWGFYNGESNTESFIPLYSSDALIATSSFGLLPNANRQPNLFHAKLFTLKKIIYPTRGYTEFDHELHTFDNDNTSPALGQEQTVTAISSTYTNTDGTVIETPFEVFAPTLAQVNYRFSLVDWPGKYNAPPNNAPPPYHSPGGPINAYAEIVNENNAVVSGTHFQYYQNEANYPHTSAPAQAIHDIDVNLSPGSYTLKVYFNTADNQILGEAKATVKYVDQVASGQDGDYLDGGGLRIASITNYDTDGSFVTKRIYNYHYQDPLGETKSHGHIRNSPNYGPYGGEYHATDTKYASGGTVYGEYQNSIPPEILVGTYRTVKRTSNTTLYQDQGSYIGYNSVEIASVDSMGNYNGKQVYRFEPFRGFPQPHTGPAPLAGGTPSQGFYGGNRYVRKFPRMADPETGLLRVRETYSYRNSGFTLVEKLENDYTINDIPMDNYQFDNFQHNPNYVLGGMPFLMTQCQNETMIEPGDPCVPYHFYWYHLHPYYKNKVLKTATRVTRYDLEGNETVAQDTQYSYESPHHIMPSRTETLTSKGEVLSTSFYYPDDIAGTNDLNGSALTTNEYQIINNLKSNGGSSRVAELVQVETSLNNTVTIQRHLFKEEYNHIVPSRNLRIYNKGSGASGYSIQEMVSYDDYDGDGNILQVSRPESAPTAIVWSYDNQYVVAKGDNVTWSLLGGAMNWAVNNMVGKPGGVSNYHQLLDHIGTMTTAAQRQVWYNFNMKLRESTGLTDALVTTYTYAPLVGVTSITDPKGYTMHYAYDDLNRLEEVRDGDGNLLSENQYHYKGQ